MELVDDVRAAKGARDLTISDLTPFFLGSSLLYEGGDLLQASIDCDGGY